MTITEHRCTCCGQRVGIYSSGEGTNSYVPLVEQERDYWRAEHDRIVGVFEADHHEQCSKRRQAERGRDDWHRQYDELLGFLVDAKCRGDRYRRRALALVKQLGVIRTLWGGATRDADEYRAEAQATLTELIAWCNQSHELIQARDRWRWRALAMLAQVRRTRLLKRVSDSDSAEIATDVIDRLLSKLNAVRNAWAERAIEEACRADHAEVKAAHWFGECAMQHDCLMGEVVTAESERDDLRHQLADSLDGALAEAVTWANQTFDTTSRAKATHICREALELRENPADGGEMADILILLAHLADREGVNLAEAVRQKLAINRQRRYGESDADGVVEHVREAERGHSN